ERPTPVFHEVRRTDERHGGFGSTEYSLCVAEAEHRAGSIRLLRADGREQDDMWDACGLDCRSDGVCAAVVVHARMARTEVRRKEDIDAFRAAEGTLERCPFVDIGDSDIRTRFAPRLPLGGVVQHDADLLPLAEQRLGDDLACIPRSTKRDEHCEPPPRCATPSRDIQPADLHKTLVGRGSSTRPFSPRACVYMEVWACFSRSVFNAPPQAVTWSSMELTAFSCIGAGLKALKFSKSVNIESPTCARTVATCNSPITSRRFSTARAPDTPP